MTPSLLQATAKRSRFGTQNVLEMLIDSKTMRGSRQREEVTVPRGGSCQCTEDRTETNHTYYHKRQVRIEKSHTFESSIKRTLKGRKLTECQRLCETVCFELLTQRIGDSHGRYVVIVTFVEPNLVFVHP